jgi:hypothetical protein
MVEGVNCNTCDRSFSSAFSLAQHLRDSPVHAPTFDCDNRTFSSASLLAQHLRHSPVHAPSSDGKALEIGLGNLNLTDQVRFHHTSSAQESNEHPPQSSSVSPAGTGSELSSDDSLDDVDDSDHVYAEPDFDLIEQLIPERGNTTERDGSIDTVDRDIGHAPLISGSIVQEHSKDAIPQYGLFGRVMAEDHDTKMFHNTNVPFSTFICGVQGSGKSHSTACMLENALIPSPQLGHLRAPVSALVFSYGEFSNGGSDFSLSEAAFLAATDKAVATSGVRKVTVLTSPSNPAIKKHYQKIPGIEILPFKLKAKSLDIAALLTLMAVNEKSEVPLYMAKVQSILRTIATENETGVFDYDLFKKRIALENFDPKQTNMLEMRLDLLEFFLDKEGNVPEPQFRPGEITIIDLSDPFVAPNTACILFKLGLERFMQSRAQAKMVVLDEAHKVQFAPTSKCMC